MPVVCAAAQGDVAVIDELLISGATPAQANPKGQLRMQAPEGCWASREGCSTLRLICDRFAPGATVYYCIRSCTGIGNRVIINEKQSFEQKSLSGNG